MKCKFKNYETFVDVAGQSSKNWNSTGNALRPMLYDGSLARLLCSLGSNEAFGSMLYDGSLAMLLDSLLVQIKHFRSIRYNGCNSN